MKNNNELDIKKAYWKEWFPPMHMILTGEEKLFVCSNCTAKYSDVAGFRFCPFCGALIESEED